MRWVGSILQCLHWLKALVWAERHEKGCVALSASPAWATHLGMRHSSALPPARTETSHWQTYIVFTHARLSADKNKSPPWLICAWLTHCSTAQTSRSCGKPRCTEACLRGTLTPLSSQRGSHRSSGHEVVSAELGQRGHSTVPSPPAAPVLSHSWPAPEAASYQSITVAGFPQKSLQHCSGQRFWGNLTEQSGGGTAGNGSR